MKNRTVLAVLIATATTVPSFAKEDASTAHLVLERPSSKGWQHVPCNSSVTNIGNIRATGTIVTSGQAERVRIGYGTSESAEAWYVVTNHQPPPATTTRVTSIVQDLDPSSTTHTFNFSILGKATTSCTITASAIPALTEGSKSPRTSAVTSLDSIRAEVRSYKTATPIPCGSAAAPGEGGRVAFTIYATSSLPLSLDLHLHNELPGANGPDQDGDPANSRFWEGAWFGISVPTSAEIAVTNQGVNGANLGVNAFHFGQQNATLTNPTRVFPEGVCSFTAT